MVKDCSEFQVEIALKFNQAIEAQQGQRWQESSDICQQILRKWPNHPDCLNLYGVVCHQTGRSAFGVKNIRRAIQLSPDSAIYYYNLAEIYRAQNKFNKAIEEYQKVVDLNEQSANLYFGLGNACSSLKQHEKAIQCFQTGLALAQDDAEIHNNLAIEFELIDKLDEAKQHYQRAIEYDPNYIQARLNLAKLLVKQKHTRQAISQLEEIANLDPGNSEATKMLGIAYKNDRRYAGATEKFEKLLSLDPSSVELLNLLGECHSALGKVELAEAVFAKALSTNENADTYYLWALCDERNGNFDSAIGKHLRAIALNKKMTAAYSHLSTIRHFKPGDYHLRDLEKLSDDKKLDDAERVYLYFAQARFADANDEFDKAFEWFGKANDLQAKLTPFDENLYLDYTERLIRCFDRKFFSQRDDFGNRQASPIFIVGMPRSGSTLIERVLSSHSNVISVGESYAVPNLIKSLPGNDGGVVSYPEDVSRVNAEHSQQLASDYFNQLNWLGQPGHHLVDKMLGNYLRLGLIAILFPNARIIHCRRNPVATCLSCFMQHFENGLHYSYDLKKLVVVYEAYQRLMKHWQDVLPIAMLEIDYESMVKDLAGTSRQVTKFCNIEWNSQCLDFHLHNNLVNTASFWQVRQPLYRNSVDRWQSYESNIEPLINALS